MQVGFKGFQIDPAQQKVAVPFSYEGKEYKLTHGELSRAVVSAVWWSGTDVCYEHHVHMCAAVELAHTVWSSTWDNSRKGF